MEEPVAILVRRWMASKPLLRTLARKKPYGGLEKVETEHIGVVTVAPQHGIVENNHLF